MVQVFAGTIHHSYGTIKVDRETLGELDMPPGGRFFGGSWGVVCPCQGNEARDVNYGRASSHTGNMP
jgi:hypothetical protein